VIKTGAATAAATARKNEWRKVTVNSATYHAIPGDSAIPKPADRLRKPVTVPTISRLKSSTAGSV
jgi:hypothetical protein